jgi:hypothetical protein
MTRSRRSALRAAAAGAGFLALGASTASAETEKDSPWPGEWLSEGKDDAPCAIFQYGRVLLLVNEHLHIAVGRITAARRLVAKDALVWSDKKNVDGVAGVLSNDGKTIRWQNGSKWRKP